MDGRVTLPKRLTSPTWGPPPSCKQALNWSRVYVMTRGLEWFLIECRKLATTKTNHGGYKQSSKPTN